MVIVYRRQQLIRRVRGGGIDGFLANIGPAAQALIQKIPLKVLLQALRRYLSNAKPLLYPVLNSALRAGRDALLTQGAKMLTDKTDTLLNNTLALQPAIKPPKGAPKITEIPDEFFEKGGNGIGGMINRRSQMILNRIADRRYGNGLVQL